MPKNFESNPIISNEKSLDPDVNLLSLTGQIAYKCSAQDFFAITEPLLLGMSSNDTPINAEDAYLVGLQIEFKQEGVLNTTANISQLYYLPKEDDFFRFDLSANDQGGGIPNIIRDLNNSMLFDIQEVSSSQLNNKEYKLIKRMQKGQDYAFENLEFFDQQPATVDGKADFVYFPIEELRRFLSIYKNGGQVVISGCELNYGKQLTKGMSGMGGNTRTNFFALKIEGEVGPKINIDVDDAQDISTTAKMPNDLNQHTSSPEAIQPNPVDGPDVIISMPCPPKWYIMNELSRVAQKINPATAAIQNYNAMNRLYFQPITKVYGPLIPSMH